MYPQIRHTVAVLQRRRLVFVSKSKFWKTRKNYHAPSNQTRCSSTSGAELMQVLEKVRKHRKFKALSNTALQEQAQNLINVEHFQDYFSDFSEHRVRNALCKVGDESSALLEAAGHESGAAATRATVHAAEMQNINVKLQLRKFYLSVPPPEAQEYGLFHTALLIGNNEKGHVLLEWDCSSLIVPQYYRAENYNDVFFEARIATAVNMALYNEARLAGKQLDYKKLIDLIFDAAVDNAKLFEELYQVIIKYNKYYHYNKSSRSCQHFVRDAMAALKIQSPQKKFKGKLKTYFEQLKEGVNKIDFTSHSELDTHVSTRLGDATLQELEYYMCMYLQFHALARSQSSELDPTKWKCEEPSCKCNEVDMQIREQESVLSHFLQQSTS